MSEENQLFDKKSLRVLKSGDQGLRDLAADCVAMANASGGILAIGTVREFSNASSMVTNQYATVAGSQGKDVAGPRESRHPGAGVYAETVIQILLQRLREEV